MNILKEHFDTLNGQNITAYTLVNDRGVEVTSLDYGCIITKLIAPDRNGVRENIVLGFDTIKEYVEHSPYFGAVIGRVAGRIQGAEFTLNGETYRLAQNDNGNHLHGGLKGFDKVIWKTKTVVKDDAVSLEYSYLSEDGEEGYPGNLSIKAVYTLTNDNELIISYTGETDRTTLVNLTNHSYFNLSGDLKKDILDHQLTLKSSHFVELNEKLIPTGTFLAVEDTAFDFRNGRKIKDGVKSEHPQNILAGNGYDHPFVLDENDNREITAVDEESGRVLTVETNQPCVVLYTSNMLSDDFSIRGTQSRKYLGFCVETQGLPDAIHHPNFPTVILEKGKDYNAVTKYTFKTV